MSHSPPSVLVWKNQGSWGTGGNIRTYLVNSDGEVGRVVFSVLEVQQMFPFGSYVFCIVLHLPIAAFFCNSMEALCAGTAAQYKVGGSFVPTESWLRIQTGETVKILSEHISSPCPFLIGYLLFACLGCLVPQVEICICNFEAASTQ